jgi:hypothetical protein
MTELTLEELAELEQRLGPSLRLTAACSMARELIRIRSAVAFLNEKGVWQNTRPEAILRTAADYGWRDPLSTPVAELKGGEG